MLIWMKSAYASKLATHFLIQTSAWLNCDQIMYMRKISGCTFFRDMLELI